MVDLNILLSSYRCEDNKNLELQKKEKLPLKAAFPIL